MSVRSATAEGQDAVTLVGGNPSKTLMVATRLPRAATSFSSTSADNFTISFLANGNLVNGVVAPWKIQTVVNGTTVLNNATQAEIDDVLMNLTKLRIRGEYNTGDDKGYLDDVVIRSRHPL